MCLPDCGRRMHGCVYMKKDLNQERIKHIISLFLYFFFTEEKVQVFIIKLTVRTLNDKSWAKKQSQLKHH